MIADIYVTLPFGLAIEANQQFEAPQYREEDGAILTILPPVRTDLRQGVEYTSLTLNGKEAFVANALHFRLQKDDFRRIVSEQPPDDPSAIYVMQIANAVLGRLRETARSPSIVDLDVEGIEYVVTYSLDDGSSLPDEEGKYRRYIKPRAFGEALVFVSPAIWKDATELHAQWSPTSWTTVLMKGMAQQHEPGLSLSLAFLSLEILARHLVAEMTKEAPGNGAVWDWITKKATTEDRFSDVLELLCGRTLKENRSLWSDFKLLKGIRDTYMHSGIPRANGIEISEADVPKYLQVAVDITDFIWNSLPEQLKWYRPELPVVQFSGSADLSAIFSKFVPKPT